MKTIATVANVFVLIWASYMLATEGVDSADPYELFAIVAVFGIPVLNLIALWCVGGDTWLGLYFKRKAMEEKKKIEALKGNESPKEEES